LDTGGTVLGGFTPLQWESRVWSGKIREENSCRKCDDRLNSFLFTLKNQHKTPARKFALKAERNQFAIQCACSYGPIFGGCYRSDIGVCNDCNAKNNSYTCLGEADTNDTGLEDTIFFAGFQSFKVREIEVFEITDSTTLPNNLLAVFPRFCSDQPKNTQIAILS
jgi:hypothetical protein